MAITIKLSELVAANGSLLELGKIATIPPKAAYQVAIAIRKTRDEIAAWTEQRRKIVRELFPEPPPDSKDPPKVVPHPHVPGEVWVKWELLTEAESTKLNEAMDALGANQVEISMGPVKLEALGAETQLTPNLLADLYWLIAA